MTGEPSAAAKARAQLDNDLPEPSSDVPPPKRKRAPVQQARPPPEPKDEPCVPGSINDRSVTGFRIRHGSGGKPMSRSFYYKMKDRDEGPVEKHVGGKVFITVAAEAEWDARVPSPDSAEAKSIEKINAMRRRRAKAAGTAALASPLHVSKFQLGRKKRPKGKSPAECRVRGAKGSERRS